MESEDVLFPFEFHLTGTPISLQAKSSSKERWKSAVAEAARLRVEETVEWTYLEPEPVALPDDLNLTVGSALPNRFLKNAFGGWNGRAFIDWADLGLAAEIDTTPHHDVLMLYAPLDRQDFFCVEPMTHLPNGHHMTNFGGLTLLQQGMEIRSCMTIEFRRKSRG